MIATSTATTDRELASLRREEHYAIFAKQRKKALPVVVVTGFLGAGKTTLIRHISENRLNLRIATCVHEAASVNVDSHLIAGDLGVREHWENNSAGINVGQAALHFRDKSDVGFKNAASSSLFRDVKHRGWIVPLHGGGCCGCDRAGYETSLQATLKLFLREGVDEGNLDYGLLETSGAEDPMRVCRMMEQQFGALYRIRLDLCVCVIDCSEVLSYGREKMGLVKKQLRETDLLVLNKMELLLLSTRTRMRDRRRRAGENNQWDLAVLGGKIGGGTLFAEAALGTDDAEIDEEDLMFLCEEVTPPASQEPLDDEAFGLEPEDKDAERPTGNLDQRRALLVQEILKELEWDVEQRGENSYLIAGPMMRDVPITRVLEVEQTKDSSQVLSHEQGATLRVVRPYLEDEIHERLDGRGGAVTRMETSEARAAKGGGVHGALEAEDEALQAAPAVDESGAPAAITAPEDPLSSFATVDFHGRNFTADGIERPLSPAAVLSFLSRLHERCGQDLWRAKGVLWVRGEESSYSKAPVNGNEEEGEASPFLSSSSAEHTTSATKWVFNLSGDYRIDLEALPWEDGVLPYSKLTLIGLGMRDKFPDGLGNELSPTPKKGLHLQEDEDERTSVRRSRPTTIRISIRSLFPNRREKTEAEFLEKCGKPVTTFPARFAESVCSAWNRRKGGRTVCVAVGSEILMMLGETKQEAGQLVEIAESVSIYFGGHHDSAPVLLEQDGVANEIIQLRQIARSVALHEFRFVRL
eukprot:g5829.t1